MATPTSANPWVLVLLTAAVLGVVAASSVLHPSWQQYYPMRKWAFFEEQSHGRPARVRVGQGRYRLLSPGAELMCDFPPHFRLVSNVVWERADLGDRSSLNQIYRSFGLPHEFTVHTRPSGSSLHLMRPGALDKGLYRCIVSAVDTTTHRPLTIFQDIEFYLPH